MAVTHKSAGSFKKGDTVILEGAACTVTNIQISRPGKHGHAKVRLEAVGMIDGKKRQAVMPGHEELEVPIIDKRNAQVLNVHGDKATVMDMETYETFELDIPDELKGKVVEGSNVLYWVILKDKVMKQVRG